MSKSVSILALQFSIRGRVQGVGFRWFVQQEAGRIGVSGWVRNEDDGTVKVYACGTRTQLDDLASSLHRGPRFAEVRGVTVEETAVHGGRGFHVVG